MPDDPAYCFCPVSDGGAPQIRIVIGVAGIAEGETLSGPVRFRRVWMLGDGTGCGKGKGRSPPSSSTTGCAAGNAPSGSPQSDKLLEDARRDWTALGGLESDVIPLGNFRQGMEIPLAEGVLFAIYATLRSPSRQGKPSRLDQIVESLAGSLDEEDRHAFDGVIVFDEAHAKANAAGSKGERGEVKPSQQGARGFEASERAARCAYRLCVGDRRHHRPQPRLCQPAWALGCRRDALRDPHRVRLRHGSGRGRRDGGGGAGPHGARALS